MPALFLPVVRGGMEHAQIRRGRCVEQLGDLIESVRVGVLRPGRKGVGAFVRQRRELVRRLIGQRVAARDRDPFVRAVGTSPERDAAVVGQRLVGAVACGTDHVDDRVERAVEEHLEGGVCHRPVGVGQLVRVRCSRRIHGPGG